ncbi:hypothetical protein FOZ62_003132, partial [Perkinsus olseni]
MRIPFPFPLASLVGATTPPGRTLLSIESGGKDINVRQLPKMLRDAGYIPDEEIASFLKTAEIKTLRFAHSQVVQTPDPGIDSDTLCSFVAVASSELSLEFECDEDTDGEVTGQLDPDLHVNDPGAYMQKQLKWMKMGEVWKATAPYVKRNAKVAVLDMGINWTDPELAPLKGRLKKKSGGYLEGGWNFFTDSPNMTTTEGHGTCVSRILAAKSNNSIDMAGMAPNVTLVPLQIARSSKDLPLSNFLEAMDLAMDVEVDVISMSFRYAFKNYRRSSQLLMHRALITAQRRGIILVSGAGNSGVESSNSYPCWVGGPRSLCVAYMVNNKDNHTLSNYSNYGTKVDVAAYGVNLFVGFGEQGSSNHFTGSSAATPLVSGLAAILRSMDVPPSWIKRLITHSVHPVHSDLGHKIAKGAINPLETVRYAIALLRSRGRSRGLRGTFVNVE